MSIEGSSQRAGYAALIGVLLLAGLLRGGLLLVSMDCKYDGSLTPDSRDYLTLSESLADWGFVRQWEAEIFRTPGYPLFLRAFGAPPRMTALLVAQILLDVGLVFLAWLLARQWCPRLALPAAVLQALSPLAMAYSLRVLSDSLYAFVFTLALLLFVRLWKTGRQRYLWYSAGMLAVAMYVRPVAWVMAVLFGAALLFCPGRWKHAAGFLAVFVAGLAPWVVRNAYQAGYAGFSSFAGDAMYFFAAPDVLAHSRDATPRDTALLRREFREADQRWRQEQSSPTPGENARWRLGRAMEVIGEHPGEYAALHLRGTLGFWLPGATDVLEVACVAEGNQGTVDVLHREGLIAAMKHYFASAPAAAALAVPLVLLWLGRMVGVILAGVFALRSKRWVRAWLPAAVVIISAILCGPFGLPRYRLPVVPILSIAACWGWAELLRLKRQGG